MKKVKNLNYNPLRKSLKRRKEVASPPDLLHVPKESFENFIQFNKNPYERENKGLENILRTSFPFIDPNGQVEIRYIAYEIGDWECGKCRKSLPNDVVGGPGVKCPECGGVLIYKEKHSVEDCKYKGLTYSAPLRVLLELVVNQLNPQTGEIIPKFTKKEKVYFGDVPLLTDHAYFIINGSERVVVSQLIRSSGIFFEGKEDKTKDILTRIIYKGSVIPEKGSRLEFEHATNVEIFNAKIDRRKVLGTTILRAFGLDTAYKILKAFYGENVLRLEVIDGKLINPEKGLEVSVEELSNDEIFITFIAEEEDERGKKVNVRHEVYVEPDKLEKFLLDDRIEIEEVVAIDPLVFRKSPYGNIIIETLKKDQPQINKDFTFKDAARVEIYRKMRPTDTAVMDPKAFLRRANELFESIFYDPQRYDLSKVGRVKINAKIHDIPKTIKPLDLEYLLEKYPPLSIAEDVKVGKEVLKAGTKIDEEVVNKLKSTKFKEIKVEPYLDEEARFILLPDVINIVKYLLELRLGKKELDDIAHLGNRRVRPIGELLENQARIGLVRMNKAFKDRIATVDIEDPSVKPGNFINPRYLTG
ncbi:MAG: DNA-directed RNA polymerase subunit beta, partial [Aquificota bacterium]